VVATLATGCHSVEVERVESPSRGMSIEGLDIADGLSDTTRDVIVMLGIDAACARPVPACADLVLTRPGMVRPATRSVAAAELWYRYAVRARPSDAFPAWLGCARETHRYLFAPTLAGRSGALEGRSQLALRLHNACVAGLLHAVELRAARPRIGLRWEVDHMYFPSQAVERIRLADRFSVQGLRTRQYDDGLGVAAVAIGAKTQAAVGFPAQPFALAVNLRFEVDPAGTPAIVVSDASRPRRIDTALGSLELARDVSAAYATAADLFGAELTAWQALRGARGSERPEIRLLAPYDPAKTPVILIHGLASSPLAWVNVANELLGDPDISANFQIWLVRYSTGQPLLVNRQQIGTLIDHFRRQALAGSSEPPRNAVLVGHSMGGVLARLLVTDSGSTLWQAAFMREPEMLQGPPDAVEAARRLLIFAPIGAVDEVVFIAAPHGGSEYADGTLARLTRSLIHLPADALSFLGALAQANPDLVSDAVRSGDLVGGPTSFDTLSPDQPLIQAGRKLPIADGIEIHSIIGVRDEDAPEKGDGIVSLTSAQWPQGSETRVRGGHDIQNEPETINLLKAILLERLRRQGVLAQ
jgi:triacylglycerol esterase/lipase EstA (alpha/beta hydrolase family)